MIRDIVVIEELLRNENWIFEMMVKIQEQCLWENDRAVGRFRQRGEKPIDMGLQIDHLVNE